jgi:hypothetical protein
MRRVPFAVALLAVAVVAAVSLGPAQPRTDAQAGTPMAGQGFVGAWRLTTQTPFGASQSLVTLMADGTMLFSDRPSQPGGAGFPVTFISAGHGAWHATGPNTAAATWVEFVTDGKGDFLAVVTGSVVMTLGADGTSWSGPFSSTTTDPAGKILFVGTGTVERAARITVQPLATPPAASPPAGTPAA